MASPLNAASLFGASSSATSGAGGAGTANAGGSSGGVGAAGTQTLGKDAFLKLLMAQLSNQDPLQPTDSTQFVTQLSQFSMVEQSVQQSSQLSNIVAQLQSLSGGQATALIGKSVTLQNTGMNWNGTFATTANVTLGGAAGSVSVTVQDAQGNAVRNMTLGPQPAGALRITWDGHEDNGQPAPAGSYSVSVKAANAQGQSVDVAQTVSGTVSQVSLNQGVASLTLSNGAVAPLSQLVSVSTGAATAGAQNGGSK